MVLPKSSYFVAAFLAARLDLRGVHAHGYLKTPRSRNYVASLNPVWWGGTATDPDPENCPHCLNIGGTEARCGKVGDHNYDTPTSAIGGALAPVAQACYAEGTTIDVESVLTAHHKGHFELKACPVAPGEVPTQSCFDAHKLTFVEDVLNGAPPDPLYPERAYIPLAANSLKDANGSYRYHHRYKLPQGLRGDLVLLQWYYVTANSCAVEGYDTYNFPPGFDPTIGKCTYVAPDGRGLPEQFWNCAEVRVTNSCGTAPSPNPPTVPSPTKLPTPAPSKAPVPPSVPAPPVPTPPTPPAPTPPAPNPNCAAHSNQCSATVPCAQGGCCSQWGYCGTTAAYCGDCCQGASCWGGDDPAPLPTTPAPVAPPAPTPTTPMPPAPPNHSTDHGEDSRLIAYVGNWQDCPTDEQVDNYSHMVVAFAVSYTWSASKNACDNQCSLASTVPICANQNRQDLVDSWRAKGKKVILSFGGAGMGGSWAGDNNNCWDYCFGKEEALSSQLINIISNQNFDGIDIDYEYCYDVAGKQAGKCPQRTSLYSDAKAQTFLDKLTSDLRVKLDALQATNGYDRGRYEITHAPMDSDLVPSSGFESQYFRILKDRRADLDFLMPQFYNGVTRPGLDGVDGTGAGSMSAAAMFSSLANDLFDQEPHKVVFGFCISDCSGTGSNISSDRAVEVMFNLKAYNNDEFVCNGGAFFWVSSHDSNGSWSYNLAQEVGLTAGCSVGGTPFPTASPTNYPTYKPTASGPPTGVTSSPTPSPSKRPSSSAPIKSPTVPPTKRPTTQNGCVAVPQDQLPPGQWATTDEQCKLCESGRHPWWPCNANLCNCGGSPTPQDPTPAPVNSPPAPNPNCAAQSNQCSATNPCPAGLCCSQWGYCGSAAGYCGDCCQSGNCWA